MSLHLSPPPPAPFLCLSLWSCPCLPPQWYIAGLFVLRSYSLWSSFTVKKVPNILSCASSQCLCISAAPFLNLKPSSYTHFHVPSLLFLLVASPPHSIPVLSSNLPSSRTATPHLSPSYPTPSRHAPSLFSIPNPLPTSFYGVSPLPFLSNTSPPRPILALCLKLSIHTHFLALSFLLLPYAFPPSPIPVLHLIFSSTHFYSPSFPSLPCASSLLIFTPFFPALPTLLRPVSSLSSIPKPFPIPNNFKPLLSPSFHTLPLYALTLSSITDSPPTPFSMSHPSPSSSRLLPPVHQRVGTCWAQVKVPSETSGGGSVALRYSRVLGSLRVPHY